MRTLVLAEHDNCDLKPQTLNAVTCARQLGAVDILVAGADCAPVAEAAAQVDGVDKVLLASAPALQHGLAEALAPVVCGLMDGYDALLAPATTNGKNVLPRVAAMMDVQQISDVLEVLDANTFKRPIYAGNAIATVKTDQTKNVITVRTTAFEPAPSSGGNAPVESIDAGRDQDLSAFVSEQLSETDRPELAGARVVVSGGRGVGAAENFQLLADVADKLGGAVGASRAAVDAGFMPNDAQVGQTGKVVAPELYIAAGISGAIQHLAGMKDSQVIVAINTDEDAPIFKVADYGLVADLHQALPALSQALARKLEQ